MPELDFQAIDAKLKAVLNVISGVPGEAANSLSQAGYFPQVGNGPITDGRGNVRGTGANTQARVEFDILAMRGLGYDEYRDVYDPDIVIPEDTYQPNPAVPSQRLGGIVTTATGPREIIVQVKVECYDMADGKSAWPIANKIMMRLSLPSVIDSFREAHLGIQGTGAITPTDYDDENGRKVSVAMFEIRFNAADSADDDPDTTIEQLGPQGLTVRT